MAPRLRVLATVIEDLDSVPSTYVMAEFQEMTRSFLTSMGTRHGSGTYIFMWEEY